MTPAAVSLSYSANILLDKYMEAKISDLGQAQQATAHSSDSNTNRHTHITREQATTKLYGTRAYQPLEVQSGGRPSTKSDMFSMGVVSSSLFSCSLICLLTCGLIGHAFCFCTLSFRLMLSDGLCSCYLRHFVSMLYDMLWTCTCSLYLGLVECMYCMMA